MSDIEKLERRIEELESQLAFSEDLHRSLDDTVARQDREILELKRRLEAMEGRLGDLASAMAEEKPEDSVPPHY
ncbi:MAG: SlyX family protein [Xanthomonadales bacterium]|nr:SlyX family protein [Xanthomonadales bacterium]